MDLQYFLGIVSTLALLSPVVILLMMGLYKHKVYGALLIYCFLAFIYSLMTENIINTPIRFERFFAYTYNLLDVPLIMTFLLLFAKSNRQRRLMTRLTGLYLLYEIIVVIAMRALNKDTIAITMGPGLAMVLIFCTLFFMHRIKIATTYQKAIGKAIIISAILFAYVCFSYIYVIHYIIQLNAVADAFLLYYLVAIIYNITLTIGLVIEKKRVRKLDELLVTRKELTEIFAQDPKTKPAISNNETADSWRFN
ncbi:MAG: hypothetical protein GC171_03515 [Terrimonas sp.]|nr:hypothetical protein [Terrimonas sp.]